MNGAKDVLLDVRDLKVWFDSRGGVAPPSSKRAIKAVNGVSFLLRRGQTLGLVGESGSGKSTTGRALLRLIEPTSGSVTFDGTDLSSLSRSALRRMRPRMAMVFQDPMNSLDPQRTVGQSVAEPLEIHGLVRSRRELQAKVGELFEAVGMNPDHAGRYPRDFSGGQQQRIGIARALSGDPDLLVADEPVASLDVSVQAQVLNLLSKLRRELGLTMVFIAHDLATVQHISDIVGVMYLGQLAELSSSEDLYRDPRHPYTRALLSAVPVPDPIKERSRERIILTGELPSPLDPPIGCSFSARCPEVHDRCLTVAPMLRRIEDVHVACHLYDEGSSSVATEATDSSDVR